MGQVNQNSNLLDRIKDLQRQIDELRKSAGLGNAVISRGTLKVKQTDGSTIFEAGEINAAPGGQEFGFIARRPDGTVSLYSYSTDSGDGFWAGWDKSGNIIMSEDGTSGQGLARPYIPYNVLDFTQVTTPTRTTTSATYDTMYRAHGPKQHPKVHCQYIIKTDADTTCDVQMILSDGTLIAGPNAHGLASFAYGSLTGTIPGTHMQERFIDIQARRTAGTGNVKMSIAYIVGRQT